MSATDLVPTDGSALAPDRVPWEKQPRESFKAFGAFALYRDLGPQRTLTKVARILLGVSSGEALDAAATKKLENMRRSVGDWSAKHGWVARCEAYDMDVDRRMREQRESDVEKFRREEVQIGYSLQGLAIDRIKGKGEAGEVGHVPKLDPKDLDAGDVVQLLREGDRLARLGMNLPTDFTKGMDSWSTREVIRLAREIVDALMEVVPEDQQHEAISRVEGIFESWQRRG